MEAISQKKLVESGKQGYEMPSTKVEAFLGEFPWITSHIFQSWIRQIYVSRITPEVLSNNLAAHQYPYKEKCYNEDGCAYYKHSIGHYREKVFLLDGSGSVVNHVEKKEVVEPAHSRRRLFLLGPIVHFPEKKELVVDEIKSCEGSGTPKRIKVILDGLKDDADKVRFILSYYEKTGAVIIYKAPPDILLRKWIQVQIEAERFVLKLECQAIDAEAGAK